MIAVAGGIILAVLFFAFLPVLLPVLLLLALLLTGLAAIAISVSAFGVFNTLIIVGVVGASVPLLIGGSELVREVKWWLNDAKRWCVGADRRPGR